MLLPQTIESLARIGANIEINSEINLLPQTLESIVRICVANGGHVTISAQGKLPQTLENLARIGRNNLTIRV
ncbi:hypothetical protein [Photobacterium damselae]|uniref:hypothetical protein n=1 Tax=Photobacterium damselae TaxID=38293 RepID=UPI000D055DF9|nr:hypothetical protein [Photobacterium damselae]PSB78130.1 hypothetical protein C5F62_18755 [Photobacterium damselae subsp. damselae]